MKEKIIKILEKKAECTMNGHSDFDNVDVTQFEVIAEEVEKLCNLHFASKQRELLCFQCGKQPIYNKRTKLYNKCYEQYCNFISIEK